MNLSVGYDKDLSAVFFRRTLNELIVPTNRFYTGEIIAPEINYVSERLAETAIYPYDDRFASPWLLSKLEIMELAAMSPRGAPRSQLQKAELAANNLLIFLGIVERGGICLKADSAKAVRFRMMRRVRKFCIGRHPRVAFTAGRIARCFIRCPRTPGNGSGICGFYPATKCWSTACEGSPSSTRRMTVNRLTPVRRSFFIRL